MLQCNLQAYFIFTLCVIIISKCGVSELKETKGVVDSSSCVPVEKNDFLPKSCNDLQTLGGVFCKSKNNKSHIEELIFTDLKYLPPKILEGLSIKYLAVQDPDMTVDENVLDGIVKLDKFEVYRSSIEVIPDFRFVKKSIKYIAIQSSRLTSLEGENLQNLTLVKDLSFVNNSIHFIHPDVFKGTENVETLALSHNHLMSIPPHLLDPMKKLNMFTAARNNLLHVTELFDKTAPQIIYLFFNNITDGHILTRNVVDVKALVLSGNPIKEIVKCPHEKCKMRTLYLSRCRIEKFDARKFYNIDNLEILDLSYNLIDGVVADYGHLNLSFNTGRKDKDSVLNLSRNKLSSLKNLLKYRQVFATIKLARNQIQYLTNEDFRFVPDTEHLQLQENQISSMDRNTFSPVLKNLIYLDLSYNSITSLNGSINGLSRLKRLDLSHNLIESLTKDEFRYVQELIELFLKSNKIKVLWLFIQVLNPLETLDIRDNEIETIRFEAFHYGPKIKCLQLSGNKLKYLNLNMSYLFVSELVVAENQLDYLANSDFRALHEARSLAFQGNQIEWIDTDAFKRFRLTLNYLDLSSNSITSVNGTVRYMHRLNTLNLSSNNIQSFARDEFDGLFELSCLYLNNNKIKVLWNFQKLLYLKILDIRDNEIEIISADQVPRPTDYNTVIINLRGNNFECDCRRFSFALQLIESPSIKTDIGICLESDFGNNPNTNFNWTEMCSYECTKDENEHFITVDCSSKNLTDVPEFLRNSFQQDENSTTISSDERHPLIAKQNVHPSLNIEDKVLGINLQNNSLESLQNAQLPSDLIHLFLSHNKLSSLPNSILDNQRNLKHVSLSGNPWICDCDALKFKKWLTSNHKIIRDIDNVRCAMNVESTSSLNGKVIWTLSDTDLCPVERQSLEFILSISLGVLSLLTFCSLTKMLYIKYNLHIKVFLYSHGLTFVKEEDLDYDKVFDAFLSFSHEDGEYITNEIISGIEEKDPNIRLCIHYRHFIAGELIYKNIINAVQNSKRTVVFLTKNFLESEWCLTEFRTAHLQQMEDKLHRVIMIKMEDLPKDIDPEIKAYLQSTTYLTWGEKNFWNKLLYILPSGGSVRNFMQEV